MNEVVVKDEQENWLANLREALRASTGLAIGLWWNVALLVASVAALPFDKRIILGLNPWIKPIKFEISVILFLATIALLVWSVGRTGMWRRSRAWLGWGFGICMIIENSIIALQSARGVRSHMNFATVKDALLFSVMGLFIALNTVLVAWLLVLWFRTRTGLERVVVWGRAAGADDVAGRECGRNADRGAPGTYGRCGGWWAGVAVCELEPRPWGPAGGALLRAALSADLSAGGVGAGEDTVA